MKEEYYLLNDKGQFISVTRDTFDTATRNSADNRIIVRKNIHQHHFDVECINVVAGDLFSLLKKLDGSL